MGAGFKSFESYQSVGMRVPWGVRKGDYTDTRNESTPAFNVYHKTTATRSTSKSSTRQLKLRMSNEKEKDADGEGHIYHTPGFLDLRNSEQNEELHSDGIMRTCNSCPALPSPPSPHKDNEEPVAIPPLRPLSPLILDDINNANADDAGEPPSVRKRGTDTEGKEVLPPTRSRLDPKSLYDSEEFKRLKEKHEKQLYRESLLPPPRHHLHNLSPEFENESSILKTVMPELPLPDEVTVAYNPLPPTYCQRAYPSLRPPPSQTMQSYYDWDVITANIEVIKKSMTKWEQLEQDIECLLSKKASACYNCQQSTTNQPIPARATSVTDILNQ